MGIKLKSLKARGEHLANAQHQLDIIENLGDGKEQFIRFEQKLNNIGMLPLRPTQIEILQLNLGKMCNQTCEHCHVDAGPDRKEIMTKATMTACLESMRNSSIQTVDLTGGAPEMNPNFKWLVTEITKMGKQVIVRSNLTILVSNKQYESYASFFKDNGVMVISSLPCYTKENTDKQRGEGVFGKSIAALKLLNSIGYGVEGSGLALHLVYNPGGPSLPPSQESLKSDYKRELMEQFGIVFNELYTITNLPISRFLDYLMAVGRYEEYMHKLIDNFNPSAAMGVMCRNTLSVGWDGQLYDCDFNQMLELNVERSAPQHINDFNEAVLTAREIVVNQHCYGCTAGAGSSCQGSIA
jgi:radical SAM/Cys-rich protein